MSLINIGLQFFDKLINLYTLACFVCINMSILYAILYRPTTKVRWIIIKINKKAM